MGRREVINVLKKNNWVTAVQIAKIGNMGVCSTTNVLSGLTRHGEVRRRGKGRVFSPYEYQLYDGDHSLNRK